MSEPASATVSGTASERPSVLRRMRGYLEELGLLVLVLAAVPLAILLLGAPLMLLFKAVAFVSSR